MKKITTILIFIVTLSCNGLEMKSEYSEFIKEIITKRDYYKIKYDKSKSINKPQIIIEARDYLINIIANKVFPYWYGTEWDFNGTTRTLKKVKLHVVILLLIY